MKPISTILLIILVVLVNLLGALYFYYYLTGQINDARILYENAYGNESDFNSIFWICQKVFNLGH